MSDADSAQTARGLLDFALGPGSIVADRYELVRKIGAGGMGSVWLAQDRSLDAPCAIKLVNDDKVTDPEVRARFAREAKSSAQLRSPHVVRVFDHGESDGRLYIAMEWLEGEDLSTRLDRVGALDLPTAYRVVAHVSRALMSAHAMGIVHRDLKPENVFLVQGYDEEIAKVLDFGIARHNAYSLQDRATRTGSFLGSPFYVSPEQARGRPVDHRSDLWSLGVIAFQCLTGRLPFESEAIGELLGLILYDPLRLPTAVNPALPPALDEWWKRAASRDREHRFQSAKDLADELAASLGLERFVTVPPAARLPISSFPGVTDASGIFTPFTGEFPTDQHPGKTLRPSANPLLGPQNAPEQRQSVGPDARTIDAPAIVRNRRMFWGGRGLKGLAIGLLIFAVVAGLAALLALRAHHPRRSASTSEQQSPSAKIVVSIADPKVPEPEPAPAVTGISPESLPIELPEAAGGDSPSRAPGPTIPGQSTLPRPRRLEPGSASAPPDYGI